MAYYYFSHQYFPGLGAYAVMKMYTLQVVAGSLGMNLR